MGGPAGDKTTRHSTDINGKCKKPLGMNSVKNIKQDKWKEWLVRSEVDIACIQEVGVNWGKCKKKDKLAARMNSTLWEKMSIAAGYNKPDNHSKSQYGGTAVIAFGSITSTVDEVATDLTGLGQWASIKLSGRSGKKCE